jgi:uncharacterized protein YjeT (DUF2065 family)
MDIGWSELARYLGGAFALYMVLEGVLPFLNPGAWQRWMAKLAQIETKQLRGRASPAVDGAQWVKTSS